ncbi:hypothetical protein [Streptomyces sp. NPDC088789]|uniref:hypothetical protein n=1 Tax=Streptomyces sp. NPDC088789 TaxID=3365899 RepID=UPI00380F2662
MLNSTLSAADYSASATFVSLWEQVPAAAKVLLDDTVAERIATIPGVHGSVSDVAFAYGANGLLLTCLSDGKSERWHAPTGEEDTLNRASAYFRSAVKKLWYSLPILLGAGQCLIMRNDRLSPAREAFDSAPERPRHPMRGLYRRSPGEVSAVSRV